MTTMRKPSWPLPAMDLRLLLPPLRLFTNPAIPEPQPQPQSIPTIVIKETTTSPKQSHPFSELGTILMTSLRSVLPTTARRPAPPPNFQSEAGCSIPLFRPYVARVPWHGGVRAFLSQLFPRYGHYCGPNWSSGKDGGSMLWDHRPIDWLDFCCYCHDIGYDTHDQAKLLKADLQFLECLEKPRMATKGGAHAALLYRAMCIAGLRNILIPYRMHLVRLQAKPPFSELVGNLIRKRNTIKQAWD